MGDALLVKPEIKNIESLKWRSIGYENKAAGALLLDEVFTLSGLNNQTIQLFEVKQSEAKDIYMQGHIDGLIVREPEKTTIITTWGARTIKLNTFTATYYTFSCGSQRNYWE